MAARRFPRRLYDHGSEPDPRFSLANERTIQERLRLPVALLLTLLEMGADVQARTGWLRTERALRANQALPARAFSWALAVGLVVTAATISICLLR